MKKIPKLKRKLQVEYIRAERLDWTSIAIALNNLMLQKERMKESERHQVS